jgi:hypothetical protein
MFLFDNKYLGYARQSRINHTIYMRKVRTSNEQRYRRRNDLIDRITTSEGAILWKVPQKITASTLHAYW